MLGLLTKIWRRPISLRLSVSCQLGFSWCRWAVSWVRPPVQWKYSPSVEVFNFSRMQEKNSPPVDIFNFNRRQQKYLPSVSGCRRRIFEEKNFPWWQQPLFFYWNLKWSHSNDGLCVMTSLFEFECHWKLINHGSFLSDILIVDLSPITALPCQSLLVLNFAQTRPRVTHAKDWMNQ